MYYLGTFERREFVCISIGVWNKHYLRCIISALREGIWRETTRSITSLKI